MPSAGEHRTELLAPAGNWPMLRTAVKAGADAVYLGVRSFNMRAAAVNFRLCDLVEIVDYCHHNNVLAYLTLNTIVYDHELSDVTGIIDRAKDSGMDAVICWDPAVIQAAAIQGMSIHVSTQASISNSEAAGFYERMGAQKCVLARECSLIDIKRIRNKTKLAIEVFAHGAMCIAVSGRCFMSQFIHGRSASRGDCLQPCRRDYEVVMREKDGSGEELVADQYSMSSHDLCTLPFIDRLLPYVDSLKIEGRARSPEYVATVVGVYREALDAVSQGSFTQAFVASRMRELYKVCNRGFTGGYYMGKPVAELQAPADAPLKKRKSTLGRVVNYYSRIGVAEVYLTGRELRIGDEILVVGHTSGTVRQTVMSMEQEHKPVTIAGRGQNVGLKLDHAVRRNDRVYLWE